MPKVVVIGLMRQRVMQRVVLSVAHPIVVRLIVDYLPIVAALRESIVIALLGRVCRTRIRRTHIGRNVIVIGVRRGLDGGKTTQSDKRPDKFSHDRAPFGPVCVWSDCQAS